MMDRDDMISYIGQKRNPKIIDTFRSLSEPSLSLNACVKERNTITIGKKQSADMTEEENEALGRIVDRIFRCVVLLLALTQSYSKWPMKDMDVAWSWLNR